MNIAGTIFILIIGILLYPATFLSEVQDLTRLADLSNFGLIMLTVTLLWLILTIYIVIQLFRKAILGLDRRMYDAAKYWTMVGMLFGLVVGVIPFIIFLISYVSFDNALKNSDDYRRFLAKTRRMPY